MRATCCSWLQHMPWPYSQTHVLHATTKLLKSCEPKLAACCRQSRPDVEANGGCEAGHQQTGFRHLVRNNGQHVIHKGTQGDHLQGPHQANDHLRVGQLLHSNARSCNSCTERLVALLTTAATSITQGAKTQEDEKRSVKRLCQLLDLTAACEVCVLCGC